MRNLKEYCENPPKYDFIFGILGFITFAAILLLFMFNII